VGTDGDAPARIEQCPKGGDRRAYPHVVPDDPVLQRNVEVAADEDPPALDLEVVEGG
jgi:hypothetical protein